MATASPGNLSSHGWTAWIFWRPSTPTADVLPDGSHHSIEVCNRLLREEIAAVAWYDQAVDRFTGKKEAGVLFRIRESHVETVNRLQCNIFLMGGLPDPGGGGPCTFAWTGSETPPPPKEVSAIYQMEQGERRVQRVYIDALGDSEVMDAFREMIRRDLLPQIEWNIAALNELTH